MTCATSPKLNARQQIFVAEFLSHGDAELALERAGYKKRRYGALKLIQGSRAIQMAIELGKANGR